MATLTVRLTEAKAARLKAIAGNKNISVNKLIDELATYAIAEYDVQTRYQVRAKRGSAARGLATLDKLDAYYADAPSDGASLHDSASGDAQFKMPSSLKKPTDD